MYAFDVDGYGPQSLVDDANLPLPLSVPFFGYVPLKYAAYVVNGKFGLPLANFYLARGPVINGLGSPHAGPVKLWPSTNTVY